MFTKKQPQLPTNRFDLSPSLCTGKLRISIRSSCDLISVPSVTNRLRSSARHLTVELLLARIENTASACEKGSRAEIERQE